MIENTAASRSPGHAGQNGKRCQYMVAAGDWASGYCVFLQRIRANSYERRDCDDNPGSERDVCTTAGANRVLQLTILEAVVIFSRLLQKNT